MKCLGRFRILLHVLQILADLCHVKIFLLQLLSLLFDRQYFLLRLSAVLLTLVDFEQQIAILIGRLGKGVAIVAQLFLQAFFHVAKLFRLGDFARLNHTATALGTEHLELFAQLNQLRLDRVHILDGLVLDLTRAISVTQRVE